MVKKKKMIKAIRKKTGLTKEKFAQKLGVSYATVSRWERGAHQISDGHWNLIKLVFPKESEVKDDNTGA